MRFASTPFLIKYLATTDALLIDNLEFNFSAPVLSVCPPIARLTFAYLASTATTASKLANCLADKYDLPIANFKFEAACVKIGCTSGQPWFALIPASVGQASTSSFTPSLSVSGIGHPL